MCLAVPGQIKTIDNEDPIQRSGKVSFGGIVKEINLAYVPEAKVDDWVVVHVGFALSVLDPDEAAQTLEDLAQIEAIGQQIAADQDAKAAREAAAIQGAAGAA